MSAPEISWLPPWTGSKVATDSVEVQTRVPRDLEQRWSCRRPSPGAWRDAAEGLRAAGRALQQVSAARIVQAIDQVAARWCDPRWPIRLAVRDTVVRATGFSPEAVDRSFDLELRNYRAESLERTLRREFGDPRCLDGFVPAQELEGRARAVGPQLVLTLFTGNVPGLPALSLVRALLVKSPVVAKVAGGEPSFAAAFARSLHEELPALGDAVLVTYWGRDEASVLGEVAAEVDTVIAYGGNEALRAVRAALPETVRLIEHGHKLSVGFVSARGQADVPRLAEAIARDVATFNQHACIAPQAYFVEGDVNAARQLATAVGAALARESSGCPIGDLHGMDAGRVRLARAQSAWQAARGAACDVWHDEGLEWTVTVDEHLGSPEGLGHRFLRILPVKDVAGSLEQLRPWNAFLQNVGIGCAADELEDLAEAFAQAGASRICEPGRMAEPSMMWRHDGRACVSELVRWCDIEMHRGLSRTEAVR